MSPKPASKYHALNWLLALTANNFQTKFFVEYNETDVQDMIMVKKARKALEACKLAAKQAKELAAQAISEVIAPCCGLASRFKAMFSNVLIVSNEVNQDYQTNNTAQSR